MNFKRAVGTALLLTLITLIGNALLSLAFGLELEYMNPAAIPDAYLIIILSFVLILTSAGTMWYFKPKEIKPTWKNGSKFGLIISFFGFTASFLAFLPYQGGPENFFRYFIQSFFWLTFAAIISIATLTGYCLSRKKA